MSEIRSRFRNSGTERLNELFSSAAAAAAFFCSVSTNFALTVSFCALNPKFPNLIRGLGFRHPTPETCAFSVSLSDDARSLRDPKSFHLRGFPRACSPWEPASFAAVVAGEEEDGDEGEGDEAEERLRKCERGTKIGGRGRRCGRGWRWSDVEKKVDERV